MSNPNVQEKVYTEITTVLGSNDVDPNSAKALKWVYLKKNQKNKTKKQPKKKTCSNENFMSDISVLKIN